ncbi:hypothetical protein COL26_23305 [Bacillus thuringiensis]|uniref:Uncharacterized protein n=1 Tax=Bacillus thuringiensis TaxID=1428 RepID=A0ABD6RVW0_BACTU|nr:hypothetical protein CN495_32750 [Bacillus thuringiensis]PEU98288.1 hypothetical protein CN411_00755 [Bacillus thuringiensis]PFI05608.1 hypothetical protein COI79_25490 [Bacillus thuringiensis]PFW33825.1 hypothetical protein COL26_23305 [Bacillus thuringiensis]
MVVANKYQGKTGAEILDDVNKYRNIVLEMIVELRAIKPIREPQGELFTAPPIEICLGTTF